MLHAFKQWTGLYIHPVTVGGKYEIYVGAVSSVHAGVGVIQTKRACSSATNTADRFMKIGIQAILAMSKKVGSPNLGIS